MKWGKLTGFLTAPAVFFSLTKISLATSTFCDASGNPSGAPDLNFPRVYTALGCVPVQMKDFMLWLLPKLFGITGGIALLLMIYGFIQMSMSKGDPKVVQGAKETVTSAITGLVICIGSLFLLSLIGRDILKIPGF
ncbi:MAG: hypothetical protein WC596_03865 [Candidatus Shapirobacteria bacterium]